MKKLFSLLSVLFLFTAFVCAQTTGNPYGAPAFSGGPERIQHFNAEYEVRPDASVRITETITVNALHRNIRRGIFRDLPQTNGVSYEVIGLEMDGEPHPYFVEENGDTLRVNFGSDQFLLRGFHTYKFSYTTFNGVRFFKDYDELYWNVTGNYWQFPIYSVSAQLLLPNGAQVLDGGISLYTGRIGVQGKDAMQTGPLSFSVTHPLGAGEGFTLSVAWQKGIVLEPGFFEKNQSLLLFLGFFLILWLCLIGYYFWAWRKMGRDPLSRVIRQFEPPAGFSPAQIAYVADMGIGRDILCVIVVTLVRKGVLSVEKSRSGDYILRRVSGANAELSEEEIIIMDTLLQERESLPVSNTFRHLFQSAQKAVSLLLKKWEKGRYFKLNRKYNVPTLFFILLFGFSLYVWHGQSSRSAGVDWGMALVIVSLISTLILTALSTRFPRVIKLKYWVVLFVFGIFLPLFLGGLGAICLFVVCLAGWIFCSVIRAYTENGRIIMDQIEGFKQYLEVAEVGRVMASDPTKAEQIFCEYFPYAVALGVENKWLSAFEKEMGSAFMEQAVQRRGLLFARAGGLRAFCSAFSAASRPASSSGRGRSSSGFGGGGHSGGGFGGGGGGGR